MSKDMSAGVTTGIMSTVKEGDVLVLQDGTKVSVRLIGKRDYGMFPYIVWRKSETRPFGHYDEGGRSESGLEWRVIGVIRKAVKDGEDAWREGLGVDPQYSRVAEDEPGPTKGIKHDQGKPDLSLIPSDVLWEVAEVLTHGAAVYGKYNWTKGFDYTRLQAAVLRHINQWARGIEKDVDSGKSHLTHALCGLMMLRAMEIRGLGNDDRDRTGYEKQI